MAVVSLQDVHVGFEGQVVLAGLTWHIQRGEKVGLVGPNGSGKTTLFKLVLGSLAPQIGTVTRARGLEIAYLPQDPVLDMDATLFEAVSTTFDHLKALEEHLAEVAQALADHHDTERGDDLMEEYDELQHRLETAGGYKYEVLVKEVLGGLGFSSNDYDKPMPTFSGGQKCRAALAQALLQEADLLLLDEPTNHLDIEATKFLEKFLAGYHGTAVIVSHDRWLLDRVVTKIADLDERKITVYPCAYSDYAEAKRVRQLTAEREYAKQREWIRHQREYAQRVKADKSRAKQARGRMLYLDRMEAEGRVLAEPHKAKRKMAIQFAPSKKAGDMVLRCENVRKAYGDVVLFDDFNLDIFRGQKIGIVGPNGVGKTTLLKMAMRQVAPDAGEVRLFENLSVGYYDQEQAGLNRDHTVIDEIATHRRRDEEQQIRSFLARFLFRGDAAFKRVGDLSGGEQSRVVLAKLVWSAPQVLLLDEPTNHLDIPGKEALEEALIAFEGAILLVSHDRYFLDRVVNELLVLPECGRYETLAGNWSTYEALVLEREAAAKDAEEKAREEAKLARRRAARERVRARGSATGRSDAGGDDDPETSPYANWSLGKIEDAIIEHEQKLADADALFADPDVYRDADRARTLRVEADRLRTELTALNAEWEARGEEET